ncbi:hypothetical protein [Micromonospora sp. CA-248212]|uniref:hypothetical protein n=1 Tax=Micromonospora sp. CA-248212 TaxID=3239961 RepID=UPI003D90F685
MSFFDRWNAGHKARNDSPAYDDYKPQVDKLPADYGQHPLWCRTVGHDGPCQVSTAAIGENGVRFAVTVTYNRTAENPRPQTVVEVGGESTRLDSDEAAPVFGLAGSWLALMSLPRPKPAEVEPQS